MRSELEFHDSRVVSVAQAGAAIQIVLDAYVHRWDKSAGAWKGEGWRQPVLVKITGELNPALPTGAGLMLDTGEIQAGEIAHSHLVPLPLNTTGPATLRLESMEGEVLEFSGRDLKIETTGEGAFVESLPDAFKPVG
jgi:hypothetical protein